MFFSHHSPEGVTAVKLLHARRVAPICHSLLLASAWPWRMDSLPCRKKIIRNHFEFTMERSLIDSHTLSGDLWVCVSCVRSLTLEKEPSLSHWLKTPVVRNTEEKTHEDPGHILSGTHHQTPQSPINLHPPSSCEQSHCCPTGFIGFLINTCPPPALPPSYSAKLWHILQLQLQNSQSGI